MKVEKVLQQLDKDRYQDTIQENEHLIRELLENGFRIKKEVDSVNLHRNRTETHTLYDLGVENDDGEFMILYFPSYHAEEIRDLAKDRWTLDDVLKVNPAEWGEGEFVEAVPLKDLEPDKAAGMLESVVITIWGYEQAGKKLLERSELFKEGLMKRL